MPFEPLLAVVMAGGRGSRLAPYTAVLPKPLMPLGDRPILQVLVEQLHRAGVTSVTISTGHLSGLIESWVQHHGGLGPINFVREDTPRGTAGALGLIERPAKTFLALNGDILTTLNFANLIAHHRRTGSIATVAINERVVDVQYGIVHTDSHGRVERLEEKPQLRYRVSMGVYAMEPSIVDLIGKNEHIDFPTLLLRAIERGHEVQTYEHRGYWRDIGNRDDYESATEDFANDPGRFTGLGAAP